MEFVVIGILDIFPLQVCTLFLSIFSATITTIIELSEFCTRQQLLDKKLMANNQKSVDRGQKVGAPAIFVSSDMGYDNEIIEDEEGSIVRILVSGTGGRTINKESNKYEKNFNQPLHMNLAMLVSAENELPIRVLLKIGNKIVYLGLWTISKYEYKKVDEDEVMVWIFSLEKSVAK